METQRCLFKLVVSLLLVLPFYSRKGCYLTCAVSQPRLPSQDVVALSALLKRTSMPWKPNRGVFQNTDCEVEFYQTFIRCNCHLDNGTICRVTELDFSDQKVEGRIPVELGDLTELKRLDLSMNKFGGPVPKSLANLTKLEKLDLSSNQLVGPMPSFFGGMKSLENLALYNNWFNGTIPPQLGELPYLDTLWLDNNLLSGEIPKELGKLKSLRFLTLYDNKLEGRLPDDLGNLSNLEEFWWSGFAEYTGDRTLPVEFFFLYLLNNRFSGILPSRFKELKKLRGFYVQGSNLLGKFPAELLFNWQQLQYVWLVGNYFEGPFPEVFLSTKDLKMLVVTDLLGGENGFQIPDLSQLTALTHLTLRNCSLTGPIPNFIWQLRKLQYLDLSFNQLTGGIPPSIRHHSLDSIFLRSNKLNQSMPRWLIHKNISYVDISENFFTNERLPTRNLSQNLNLFACCSNISRLTKKWQQVDFHCPRKMPKYDNLYINCGGAVDLVNGTNSYEADLKPEGASTFYLSKSGRWAYSSMGTSLTTDKNRYLFSKTCNLSMANSLLYQTARGAPVSLKYYGLCLKRGQYIVKLHFAEIAWDANQVFGIKDRRVFDVEIQGKKLLSNFNIEAEAGGVDKNVTREFVVPVNDSRLEIHLYWSGKGSVVWPINYGPLISAISVSPVPKEHKKLSSMAIAGIGVSVSLSVILVVLLLWRMGIFGGKKEPGLGIELYPGGVYTFQQIKAATENFADANKLGEGGFGPVYKGGLKDGNEIAVKQLSARSKQGIHEFVNEIGTISALQHPNLVRLMGCCVQDNQMLLIYEYMQNNSLDHALFGPDEELKSRLNWPTRFKICLDIAKGLAFLHEESKLKIIHRDIKPTNILLDKDLNAKISDFGYAKLYEEDKAYVTRVQGTTGYMAPEYAARGLLTPKADVYSFGVVTLEIVSGKNSASYKPNEQTVYLLDLAYVLQQQGNLAALIDPNLGSEYSWKEATTILELAMRCTNPSPTLRPTMSEVVKILRGKTKIKTTSTSVPYSVDNFTMAKAVAALAHSAHSSGSSQQEASSGTMSHSASKEIECSESNEK